MALEFHAATCWAMIRIPKDSLGEAQMCFDPAYFATQPKLRCEEGR